MKVVFLLFYVLQGPTGEDVLKAIHYENQARCEQNRAWLKQRNILVNSICEKVYLNYE
jgi:hypothetical protein